jgi:hypothetical protein
MCTQQSGRHPESPSRGAPDPGMRSVPAARCAGGGLRLARRRRSGAGRSWCCSPGLCGHGRASGGRLLPETHLDPEIASQALLRGPSPSWGGRLRARRFKSWWRQRRYARRLSVIAPRLVMLAKRDRRARSQSNLATAPASIQLRHIDPWPRVALLPSLPLPQPPRRPAP